MIQALLHHKSHIGLMEDEKTSMIIGVLLHLSTTLMLEIVLNAIECKPFALRNVTEERLSEALKKITEQSSFYWEQRKKLPVFN